MRSDGNFWHVRGRRQRSAQIPNLCCHKYDDDTSISRRLRWRELGGAAIDHNPTGYVQSQRGRHLWNPAAPCTTHADREVKKSMCSWEARSSRAGLERLVDVAAPLPMCRRSLTTRPLVNACFPRTCSTAAFRPLPATSAPRSSVPSRVCSLTDLSPSPSNNSCSSVFRKGSRSQRKKRSRRIDD